MRHDKRTTTLKLESLEDRCVPATLTQITNAATFPYAAAVEVRITFPDGVFVGSGALIGPRTVLTAGHVAYDSAEGGWATAIQVFAGMTGPNTYVASAFVTQEAAFANYINDSNANGGGHVPGDGDIGVLTLSAPIGNQTGWFTLGTNDASTFAGVMLSTLGYPVATHSGSSLYFQSGVIAGTSVNVPGFSSFVYPLVNIFQEGGQSGSPLYLGNTLYGVADLVDSLNGYAERITSPVYTAIQTVLAGGSSSLMQNRDLISTPPPPSIQLKVVTGVLTVESSVNVTVQPYGNDEIEVTFQGGQTYYFVTKTVKSIVFTGSGLLTNLTGISSTVQPTDTAAVDYIFAHLL